jgi:DNA-binding response OmpR family regulator
VVQGVEDHGGGVVITRPILVVDDDPAILETVAEILSDEGYTVVTARNGAEGLAAVERAVPALVLLDRWMPVLDGQGFWQALQKCGVVVPVIAMTAAHDGELWANELQAAGILLKPFKLPMLLSLVAQVLRTA